MRGAETSVDAVGAVPSITRKTVGRHSANNTLTTNVLSPRGGGIIGGGLVRGCPRLDAHQTKGSIIFFAQQTSPGEDRHGFPLVIQTNASGVERYYSVPPKAKIKIIIPFQKKLPQFRKEQGKTGQVNLLLIGLHLSEIRVQGQVEAVGRVQ